MVMCVGCGDSARLPPLLPSRALGRFSLGSRALERFSLGSRALERASTLRRCWLLLAASALASGAWVTAPAHAQLGGDLKRWADSTVGLSSTKWAGPRVPFPPPQQRPESAQRLDSLRWPVSVHGALTVAPARLVSTLAAAEATYELLYAAGFVTTFGDAGQGHSAGRDLYVLDRNVGSPPPVGEAHDTPRSALPAHAQEPRAAPPDGISASAALDASGNFSALDGGRAYALLDARVPDDRVFVCTATALIEAQLFELDPAESLALRRSSASYFAGLVTGEPACDDSELPLYSYPFDPAAPASGAAWLAALSARQDQNRGTFLFDMWQFARQRTWEGHDLRASPDLLEAIGKTLQLTREEFALVAAEVTEGVARTHAAPPTVGWSALPAFSPRSAPALGVLGGQQLRVLLEQPQPGARLRVWSRGEAPGRFALSATRFDAQGNTLARLELAPMRDPNSQLHVELDARTVSVLVSVTRVEDDGGAPDPDTSSPLDLRRVSITVDAQQ